MRTNLFLPILGGAALGEQIPGSAVLGVPVQLSFCSIILGKAVMGWKLTTQCKDFDSNLFLQF